MRRVLLSLLLASALVLPLFGQTVIKRYPIPAAGGGSPWTATTLVQHKHNGGGGGTAQGVTITASGAGNLIAVGIISDVNVAITSVSDGITSFTHPAGAAAVGSSTLADWYFLPSSTAGVTTITVNFASNSFRSVFVLEVSGTGGPPVFDTGAVNAAGTATANVVIGPTITTANSSGFCAAVASTSNSITVPLPETGNEFSSGGDIDVATDGAAISLISSTAASHTPQWHCNVGGDAFVASTIAFK